MSIIEESAFPVANSYLPQGMSLRDYFAAAALQGLIAQGYFLADDDILVEKAYDLAKAMMKRRSQE